MQKFLLLLVVLFSLTACNNDDATNVMPTTSYYFNFKLDGQQVNLMANRPQYLAWTFNHVGGYQYSSDDSTRFMQIAFRFNHQPSNADVLALAGKTFRFDDTAIRPNLLYSASISTGYKNSIDSAGSRYAVNIASISFVKTDTAFVVPVDVYLVKGTCSALLEGSPSTQILSDGDFQMLISRVR